MTTTPPLSGIIPPMITPLLSPDDLDQKGLETLVEHLINGGVSGLFILGTTGEAQHLGPTIKEKLIVKTADRLYSRIPLLVGVTDTSIAESLRLSQIAADSGANAIVAAPPYFFSLGQPELIEYYWTLADRSPLPLYLYNMPSHTKTMIELPTVKVLAQHQNIIGLKDSSANGVYFCKLLDLFAETPNFGLYVGPEEMMAPMALMGAHGGVSGGANLFPELFVKLYQAAASKDVDLTRVRHERMLAVSRELYGIGKFGSSYIKGIKTALSLKNICSDVMALPFKRFQYLERQRVIAALEKLDDYQ
jgi:4-hydroxy-tetrahydrodipicolinate synthase